VTKHGFQSPGKSGSHAEGRWEDRAFGRAVRWLQNTAASLARGEAAPLRLVFLEVAEAMELVDVGREVSAVVGIASEIEAIDLGGVVAHGRREYPDGPRPSRKVALDERHLPETAGLRVTPFAPIT